MKYIATLSGLAALASLTSAQRPADTTICDYYANALLGASNATTQQTLLTLIVNTVAIGNYTQPNVGIAVPGILAPGTIDGQEVNLAPYFTGALNSTNRGGDSGVSVNFLDGGGAEPLMKNEAPSMGSNQAKLVEHLQQYFAVLLGCSEYGTSASPYAGSTNQYQVHKYMVLGKAEMDYFIQQVGLAAASFGVADADVQAVATALNSAFNVRCAAPTSIPPTAQAAPQSMCIDEDCPLAPNNTCSAYEPLKYPTSVASNSTMNGTMPSGSSTATGSAATSSFTGGASMMGLSIGGVIAAVGAAALL